MDLFLNRDSQVSLHDQLCAQIGMQIASGALAPSQKLPSIRGLAAKLAIHHNTVLGVYKTLAASGVLVLREGSGARVADYRQVEPASTGDAALRGLARSFVAEARARGFDDRAIADACAAAIAPAPITRGIVVNPHPDLQALYVYELARRLAIPLRGHTPEELEVMPAGAFEGVCFLTSTNYVAPVRRIVGPEAPVVVYKLDSSEPVFERVRSLPPDANVAVVSDSPRFLFLTAELLAGAWPEEQVFQAPLDDAGALRGALGLADLAIVDSRTAAALQGKTSVPLLCAPFVDDTWLEALARQWPAGIH